MKKVKSPIKNVVVVIELENGEHLQRPVKPEEQNFILPVLAEFDGGSLKVMPVQGIAFTNPGKKS